MSRTTRCKKPVVQGRTLAAFVAGLLLATAAETLAGFGQAGWERFGSMFQQGYVTGFLDAVKISKSREPHGYVATTYFVPAKAEPLDWAREIISLYDEERYEKMLVTDLMQIAGQKLALTMGPEAAFQDRGLEAMRDMVERRHEAKIERFRRLKEEGKLKDGEPLPSPPKPAPTRAQRLKAARKEAAAKLGSRAPSWRDMGPRLRLGFVQGFDECVHVAELADPSGFVAKSYALPKHPDPRRLVKGLDRIYGRTETDTGVLEPVAVAMAWLTRDLRAGLESGDGGALGGEAAKRLEYLRSRVAGEPTVLEAATPEAAQP